MSNYTDPTINKNYRPEKYGQGYTDLLNSYGAQPYASSQDVDSYYNRMGDQFSATFKQQTGRDPTIDELSKMFSGIGMDVRQGAKGFQGTNYSDLQNLINPYISNNYTPDIQGHQQQQGQQALQTAQQQVQDIIGKQNEQTLNQLTSPAFQQKLKGAYNQTGMLSSGAFEQGLADRLGAAASGNQSAALGSIGLPAISQMQGMYNNPYQQFNGGIPSNLQNYGQGESSAYNFNQQAGLARDFQNQMAPSMLQQWAPIIASGIQAGGNVGAHAVGMPTFICTHLKDLEIMTEEEVKQVHDKIFPYAFLHPIDLLMYLLIAPDFIRKADECGFDWKSLKVLVCDQIIACETQKEAFQKYRSVCQDLFGLREECNG